MLLTQLEPLLNYFLNVFFFIALDEFSIFNVHLSIGSLDCVQVLVYVLKVHLRLLFHSGLLFLRPSFLCFRQIANLVLSDLHELADNSDFLESHSLL